MIKGIGQKVLSPFFVIGGECMKISKKVTSIIIIAIVLSLSLNFILTPVAYAFDPVTMTLGYMGLSWAVSEAVYLFVLASAAVGVTYATWQEAKKVYDMYEGTSPAPLDNPEWEEKAEQVKQSKSDLATEYWFSQWGLEVLPGGAPDPDPESNKRGILALLGGIGVIGGFLNNFLSMFKTMELDEGVNNIDVVISEDRGFYNGYNYTTYIENTGTGTSSRVIWHIYINGQDLSFDTKNGPGYIGHSIKINNITVSGNEATIPLTISYSPATGVNKGIITSINVTFRNNLNDKTKKDPIIYDDVSIKINVTADSSLLYDGGSAGQIKKPQPNLIPIRRLRKEIDKNGNSYLVWDDTAQRLIEEVVLNTPIDEILNPEPYPYTIEPRPEGGVIIRPEIDPTTPYPNPFPQPQPQPVPTPIYPKPTPDNPNPLPYPLPPDYPNPYPWITPPEPIYPPVTPEQPDPLPYPLPPEYPDPYPWLPPNIPRPDPVPYPPVTPYPPYQPLPDPIPYPDPSPYPPYVPAPEPVPSPVTPVEPGHQIDYTPWLQVIINWLSKIWHKIPGVPDPTQEPEPEPEPEAPLIDFSPLQGIDLTDKFPFSLPWDIKASIELLVSEPKAPHFIVPMVTETIELDLSMFDEIAVWVRAFMGLIFIVALIILTRTFIGGS